MFTRRKKKEKRKKWRGGRITKQIDFDFVIKSVKYQISKLMFQYTHKLTFFLSLSGDGDMAVSHTVGSNVFDILLCLGIPWLVKTTVWDYDSTVVINSHGLFVSCFFILGSIAVTLIIIYYFKWVLDKKVGCIYLVFYFIFMGISIYVEMKAFGKYNPPMCIVDT